jgi:AraC-like DNA-binding protein
VASSIFSDQFYKMGQRLSAFTIASTDQIDEARRIVTEVYDARSFHVYGHDKKGFFANVSYFNFGPTIFSYSSYGVSTRVNIHDDNYVRVQLCLTGSGRTSHGSAVVDVNTNAIICSPADSLLEYGTSFEQFALRLDRATLERDLTSLLGAQPKEGISFGMTANRSSAQTERLRATILHAASSLDLSVEPIPPPLLRELDQTIRLSALYGIPNNFTDLLVADQKPSAPWQVKRIEEWIDAHWRESVTIEKLVDVSGASVRSIFATFKSARGYTPMAYLKKVRLNAARQLLLKAEPHASVTEIAFACNFQNSSHFATDYRLQFGELPSETLQRGKQQPA